MDRRFYRQIGVRVIDPFFSGILASIVLLWVLGVRGVFLGRMASAIKRHLVPVSVLLWAALLVFAALFILYFDYFDDIHDIDEAVQAAVKNFISGGNPYEEYVVPRFQGKYAPSVTWTYGPYNYLPLDLIAYVGIHEVIGWLDAPVWFVLANLALSGAAFVVLRRIIGTDWVIYAPIAGIVMLFFAFDNVSLTLLLMVLSMYAYKHARRHNAALAIVLMGLATLTKVFAGIPLVVLILFELQKGLKARDWRAVGAVAGSSAASAGIALLVMLPFGVMAVLDAAVFFHASEELREGTSVGGTLLSEILQGSEYYSMISAGIVFAALLVGMRIRNLNDRILLTIMAFLLVAIKSSLAPLTVAGLFLILRLKEKSDENAAATVANEASVRDKPVQDDSDGGMPASPTSDHRAGRA